MELFRRRTATLALLFGTLHFGLTAAVYLAGERTATVVTNAIGARPMPLWIHFAEGTLVAMHWPVLLLGKPEPIDVTALAGRDNHRVVFSRA